MGLYDVNGKVPVSAWVPSRDDAGNGTTTLTDLVGTSNGTLTNFALTGSTSNWVADTNAGGIRAIDCDITNDFVAVSVASYTNFMVSMWINPTSFAGVPVWFGVGTFWIGLWQSKAAVSIGGTTVSHHVTLTTGWRHIVATRNANLIQIYADGVVGASTASVALATPSGTAHIANFAGQGFTFKGTGRFDDVRLFGVGGDASDVSYLYQSGTGRGRQNVLSDFEAAGMFGGMSGAMTGGMAS